MRNIRRKVAVTAVVAGDWWLRRWQLLRRWLWGVGGSDDAGRYDGGCGGLVAPTMPAVTTVVVGGRWLRRCRPLRRWLWEVGGSDDAGRYDGGCGGWWLHNDGGSYGGGCGGLVTPTVAASRVKTLTDPAVDCDVVLEELTSAVATTVGVRFTFKLSSGFLGA